MGFDLYGSNPQHYEGKEFPIYTKYKDMDWEDRDVHVDWEKDKDKFWEEEHKLDRMTGNYFRSNVWWWRQLWNFTCNVCDEVLEEWQKEAGDTNEGIEIDEETCAKMLPLMQKAIENKNHVEYEEQITQAIAKVEKDDNGFIKNDDEWWANYPFSADFFEEFTTFVSRCGGFTIS